MKLRNFILSQSGAVTTETMVVAAGVIGLVIATFTAIKSSTETGATDADAALKRYQYEQFNVAKNSTFEVPDAAFETSWGYRLEGTKFDGWTFDNGFSDTNVVNPVVDFIEDGYMGLVNPDGGYAIDMPAMLVVADHANCRKHLAILKSVPPIS